MHRECDCMQQKYRIPHNICMYVLYRNMLLSFVHSYLRLSPSLVFIPPSFPPSIFSTLPSFLPFFLLPMVRLPCSYGCVQSCQQAWDTVLHWAVLRGQRGQPLCGQGVVSLPKQLLSPRQKVRCGVECESVGRWGIRHMVLGGPLVSGAWIHCSYSKIHSWYSKRVLFTVHVV